MEFYDKIYNKFFNLFDFLNQENIIFYLSIAPVMLLIELSIVGWDESSLKKIAQYKIWL